MNSIGQWPLFQSATTDRRVACRFSWMNQVNSKPSSWENQILIFKIFLCSTNNPPGQLELLANASGKSDWTYYPSEKEVNLLPFFTF